MTFSPPDVLKGPGISSRVRPEAFLGRVSPIAATVLRAASRSRRPECPQSHQVVGGHGEGEHPADALASPIPRLPAEPHGLQPTEHSLDALAEPRAAGGAGLARGRG